MSDKVTIVSKKDLVIEWYSGGAGTGGQYRNRHQNSCRIKHPLSGAQAQATEERSQAQNLKMAFKRLCETPEMKMFISRRLMEIHKGETIEDRVERAMSPRNLKIEGIENGQWVELTAASN